MTEEDLLTAYPRLYHMAHDGAWPALRKQGLLSVEALVDLYGVTDPLRTRLLAEHRPQSVPLSADGLEGAVVRDQKPMREAMLEKCLEGGLSPSDWFRTLNSYSFLWLHPNRVRRLIGARAYRDNPQTVLTIDTSSLLDVYRARIRLSPINSGATLFKPQKRSLATFQTIADFDYRGRAKTRSDENNVVELVIDYSVPDLKNYVLEVNRVEAGKPDVLIWKR